MTVKLKLKPTNIATGRTKNRLREHEHFEFHRQGNPDCFDKRDCLLLEDGVWLGWIPCDEVEIVCQLLV